MKRKSNLVKRLTESSVMIALATVLSLLKLVEMPYGGSVTIASMLPVLIVSYRHGLLWGIGSGTVYAVIQQLLGLNNLSYVTGWQSVLAVITLDYVLAFAVVGLGGIFKGKIALNKASSAKKQSIELALGMVLVCVLRYVCHTVAGATVWAGLSIPTEAALLYSIGYNATYMIPETAVNAFAVLWLGLEIDFSRATPVRFSASSKEGVKSKNSSLFMTVSRIIAVCVLIFDTAIIAPGLQNADSGEFDLSGMDGLPIILLLTVNLIGISAAIIFNVLARRFGKTKK